MPELPEVETTRKGIEPFLLKQCFKAIRVHQPSLRWPVPDTLKSLINLQIESITRRGKYILVAVGDSSVLIHLGMSGSLRLCSTSDALRKHDHVEFDLPDNYTLRYHDPRRFGSILVADGDPMEHPLLSRLGPEPLSDGFDGYHLFRESRKRKTAIKNFIMDSHIVVGVGNIYASEALFMSGIRPGRAASRLSLAQCQSLADNIKTVLSSAIDKGGTTLRDFVNSEGNPGYFSQSLSVYGRDGEPCHRCDSKIKSKVIGQRSSFYCPTCQV